MEIILAEKAGFCFGVKRAVDLAYNEAEKAARQGRSIYTYGPIIHNEEVVSELSAMGVKVLSGLEEAKEVPPSVIITRSHGIGRNEYEKLESFGHTVIDAACPFVTNIHKIVAERSGLGDEIIIIGDPNHAEVQGIKGWSLKEPYIIGTFEDIENLPDYGENAVTVVSQTTFDLKKFEIIVDKLKEIIYNCYVHRTICNATEQRQNEAREIASRVDAMIVIGGKTSSNTQKLYEISKQQCKNTYYIQTLDDLDFTVLESVGRVGITAGASTPNKIIKEVQNSMAEERSFEELLKEEEQVSVHTGQIVEGTVVEVKSEEIAVNIHYKSDGIVSAQEYSNTPVDLTTVVKVGDPITAKVLKINDGEGQVLLSVKRVKQDQAYEVLKSAFENETVLTGEVTQVLSGGLSVNVDECRVFIPASLVSDAYEKDLSKYLGQKVEFVLTEYDPHKRKVIGNRKKLIVSRKAAAAEELFGKIQVGDVVEGTVKNITDFGVFIDLGGADGLLHISEISWGRVENPRKIFKVGDTVKAFIKEIKGEKIALSQKFEDQNPWITAPEKYAVGTVVTGKVARMTDFGAFVVLEPGIDALLHVSQISLQRIEKPADVLKQGQEITAKVVDFKQDTQKISLSMKVLLKEEQGADAEVAEEAAAEDAE